MLPLRYPRRWQVASMLLLVVTLSAALMPAIWLWDDKVAALRWFENTDKWLHGVTFLVLSFWFAGLYAVRSFWRVALGLLVFGVVIELMQRMISYRSADLIDIAADVAGIIVGLLIGLAGAAGWCLRLENRCLKKTNDTDV
jgi:VanZ family protein